MGKKQNEEEKLVPIFEEKDSEFKYIDQFTITKLVKKYIETQLEGNEVIILHSCCDSEGFLRMALEECSGAIHYRQHSREEKRETNGSEYKLFIAYLLEWWRKVKQVGPIQRIGYVAQEMKIRSRQQGSDFDYKPTMYLPIETVVKNLYLIYGMVKALIKDLDSDFKETVNYGYIRSILYSLLNGCSKATVSGEYLLRHTIQNYRDLACTTYVDHSALWGFYMEIEKEITPYMTLLCNKDFLLGIGLGIKSD